MVDRESLATWREHAGSRCSRCEDPLAFLEGPWCDPCLDRSEAVAGRDKFLNFLGPPARRVDEEDYFAVDGEEDREEPSDRVAFDLGSGAVVYDCLVEEPEEEPVEDLHVEVARALRADATAVVDDLLARVDLDAERRETRTFALLAAVQLTAPRAESFPSRPRFVERVERKIAERIGAERALAIMENFR